LLRYFFTHVIVLKIRVVPAQLLILLFSNSQKINTPKKKKKEK
jgi:hypothetical protein